MIYDIDDNAIMEVPVTPNADHEEDLTSDTVKLSWRSDSRLPIPVGSYIVPFSNGQKYRLLNKYIPEETDTCEKYEPEFKHPKMLLGRLPFLLSTTDSKGKAIRQQEWSFSGLTTALLQRACDIINEAMGYTDKAQEITYTVVGHIDSSISVSFSSSDILSSLSQIAQSCKDNNCEYYLSLEDRALYFGQISLNKGEIVPTLKVGDNIQKASVTKAGGDYYNCFYPQGSTRNMSSTAINGDGNVATDVRLGLNSADYPDGCIYIDKNGTVTTKAAFEKTNAVRQTLALSFDSVYPHVSLYVYNVRKRTLYLKDSNTGEFMYDAAGNHILYTIWYMRLAYPATIKDASKDPVATTTDTDDSGNTVTHYWYDYVVSDSQVLEGFTLKGVWKVNTRPAAVSQPLVGQPANGEGFSMACHKAAESYSPTKADGDSGINITAGDYEIIFQQDGNIIIPSNEDAGLIPHGGDTPTLDSNIVVLYNIAMGAEEVSSAQETLAIMAKKEIKRRTVDNNSYTFKSDSRSFGKKNPGLYIGEKVIYDDGSGYQMTTRITKLVTKLDYPIIQEITVGNQDIKGPISQLKEDVSNVLAGNFDAVGINSTQMRNYVNNFTNARFLSKIKRDTAKEKIRFKDGLTVGTEYNGITADGNATFNEMQSANYLQDSNGYKLERDSNGNYKLSLKDLYVWGKMMVRELEIRKLSSIGGAVIISPCASTIIKVEKISAGYKCYIKQDDGTTHTTNGWHVGDQAKAQTFNVLKAGSLTDFNNGYYWRTVIEASNTTDAGGLGYVVLSDTSKDKDSTEPQAGDVIVLDGVNADYYTANVDSDTSRFPYERSNVILLDSSDGYGTIRIIDHVTDFVHDTANDTVNMSRKGVFIKSSSFNFVSDDGTEVPPTVNYGPWRKKPFPYYAEVSYNGSLWLCIEKTGAKATDIPGTYSKVWEEMVAAGPLGPKGDTGDKGENAVRMWITSDSGAQFVDGKGTKALTAHISYGTTEITLDQGAYTWYDDNTVIDGENSQTISVGISHIGNVTFEIDENIIKNYKL